MRFRWGTDAPSKAEVATYHISVQLGDKVYVCRYQTDSDNDISWMEGKDVQARITRKQGNVREES